VDAHPTVAGLPFLPFDFCLLSRKFFGRALWQSSVGQAPRLPKRRPGACATAGIFMPLGGLSAMMV
jgi:hypothetical protein